MSELPEEIEEADIPDLPDEILELYVARWLGWESEQNAAPTEQDTRRIEVSWHPPDGGEPVDDLPAYTSDPAAAWRLLERMPCMFSIAPPIFVALQGYVTKDKPPKRKLAEAAATLAVRGVEPREVPE